MAHSMALLGAASAKPLQFIATGLGAGYGSAVTTIDGPTYVQSYGTTYKLNKNGNVVWGVQFSGTGNKQGFGIDTSQNVYIAGNSSFVASLDANGNARWQRTIGTGISWQSLAVDSAANQIYVCGTNGSYGHIAALNASNGSVVWGIRTSTVNIEFTGIESDVTGKVSATGYISNGTTLDSHLIELNYIGNIIFQRRLSLGTSNYVFSQSVARSSSTNQVVVSGFQLTPRVNFLIQFNTSGSAISSLVATSTGGYLDSAYGTVGYDASNFLYLSMYSIYDNYIPYSKGAGYTRFLGSTPQKTVNFNDLAGGLRISTSKTDRTIAIMGTQGIIKVLGDDSIPTGTYGSYNVAEDTEGYGYSTSSISVSTDGVSYMNSGIGSSASSFSVVQSGGTSTVTYLGQ
jgi:hypothetical protein